MVEDGDDRSRGNRMLDAINSGGVAAAVYATDDGERYVTEFPERHDQNTD